MIITFLDFIFAILAGFISWGCIGYLHIKDDPAYSETKSVGLAFVAFPTAASLESMPDANGNVGKGLTMFALFCVTLFVSGITSAFGYIEGFTVNMID